MKNVDLDTIIARLNEKDEEIQYNALKMLDNEICAVQGSLGYDQQEIFDKLTVFEKLVQNMSGENSKYLYSLLSVMNIFNSDQNVIKYCLMGYPSNIDKWGLQYVRKLVFCILEIVYRNLESDDFEPLIKPIVSFLFTHNSEIEAIDFIFEISTIPLKSEAKVDRNLSFCNNYMNLIFEHTDNENKERIMLYMEELDSFYQIEEYMKILYKNHPTKYLVYLIKLNLISDAIEYVKNIENFNLKKQCLYILARNMIHYISDVPEEKFILSNSFLSDNFFDVAENLELLPAQKIDYIFKCTDKDRTEAVAIANALVHYAYCRDPVFFPEESDYKIKDEIAQNLKGAKSVVTLASVGLINSFSHEKIIAANSMNIYDNPDIGAILALAIAAQKHYDLDESILELLKKFLSNEDKDTIVAMLGISLLYSCTKSQQVYDAIFPLFSSSNNEISSFAIFVLGTVFAGSGDLQIISSCNEVYQNVKKDSDFLALAILGVALPFLKNPDLRKSASFDELDSHTKLLALGLMYVGTGMASIADEILSEAFTGDSDPLLENIGLLASCLIGVGDNIAMDLLERISSSSLLLDSPHLRSFYPFCLSLLYTSNPKPEIIDSLEKSINSGDADISSLISLGIVGAGTRSSRILRILDANYYSFQKDPRSCSALIISQGLVNLGKGLFTLSPLFYEKRVISNRAIISLISTIFFFDNQNLIIDHPYLVYTLSGAISTKYVTGFEGSCKVGKPVNVVGLAGNPNKISAAIIHTLPIVLNTNEKAECDDMLYTSYVEDVLVKNE